MGTKVVRQWLAVSAGVAAAASSALGQVPRPAPELEFYNGTTRVNPPPAEVPKPADEAILPASARMLWTAGPVEKPTPLSTVANAARDVGEAVAATAKMHLAKMFDRLALQTEPRLLPQFIAKDVASAHAMPEPVIAGPAAQPTVVVVRESAPAALAAPVEIRTEMMPMMPPRWTPEMLLALGLSAAGLSSTLLVWSRLGKAQPMVVYAGAAPMPAAPLARPTTLNGYDFGPLPETVERFDVGPSYAEVRADATRAEEQLPAAMALQLLEANLELLSQTEKTA